MQFRQATLSDVNVLLALEQAVVDAERPFNSAIKVQGARYYDIPALITDDDSHLLVAEDNGAIVATGYVQIRQSKPSLEHNVHGYLGFMYVAPAYRGMGLNKQIIDTLMAWAESKQVFDFYLDVYAENRAAINAYEKVGFQPSMLEMKLQSPGTKAQ
jgi:ribosomal protein S18 acetylase RimI-like enzyme